jgi:hypothetical protein
MSHAEAPISFTTKINGDLFTIRANSVSEFVELAAEAASTVDLSTCILSLQNMIATHSLGGTVIGEHATPVATFTVTPPAPAPTPEPATDSWGVPAPAATPLCDHGQPMKLVPAGVSKKTGKPYKAFYCCASPDREQQCKKTVAV